MALLLPLAAAVPAHAGTYVVRECDTPAGKFPNRSWSYGTSQHYGGGGACTPDVYRFRALVPRQAGYPYVRGTSRIRAVVLR